MIDWSAFLLVALVALVAAILFALLLGLPTLKLRGDYLAIVTIAAAEIPSPAPPCSLGMVTPNQPPRAMASQNSVGQRPSRSRSSQ